MLHVTHLSSAARLCSTKSDEPDSSLDTFILAIPVIAINAILFNHSPNCAFSKLIDVSGNLCISLKNTKKPWHYTSEMGHTFLMS